MNEAKLKGHVIAMPTFEWVAGTKIAHIWVRAKGQRLPVLCRGPLVEAAGRFRRGAEIEIVGFLEYTQVDSCSWSLSIVATGLRPEPPQPPPQPNRRRSKPPRDEDWEYTYDDLRAEFLIDIEPGFYYDPLEDEYVRTFNPDWQDDFAPRWKSQEEEEGMEYVDDGDSDWSDDGLEDGQEWPQ